MSMIDEWLPIFDSSSWMIKALVVIGVVLVLSVLSRLILNRVRVKANKTANPWDNVLVTSIGPPVRLVIWIVGFSVLVDLIQRDLDSDYLVYVNVVRQVGIIFSITWFLVRFIDQFQHVLIQRKKKTSEHFDHTAAEAITKLLKLSVIIVATLVTLQSVGISVAGVLTFGGVGGIAIGFAAKDLLSNFFGGLMVYLDRPFSVGDWIHSPDRDIAGSVEKIGWRITMIRGFDSQPMYIPNSVFSTITIKNGNRRTGRQIYETIGIRYDDATVMDDIIGDVTAYLSSNEGIDSSQTPVVNFTSFAPSSLDFFVYCFTVTKSWTEYHRVKQEVLLKILEIIESHGAECAFPTSTLHVSPDSSKAWLFGENKESEKPKTKAAKTKAD
ncbi:MAG: mechanosensitive ion channel [Gammaproteobacteria bacterium]|nr:mechanosensitive ion channel [Gammaproteobacteria bacterium]